MADLDRREEFLISMYNQLMNDINRHIVVVWQSIATLVAAVATFSLVKDNILSTDIASSIVLLACIWLLAHVYDASYWYNRNLVIIANIERQFLIRSDLNDIHYYFGEHRPKNVMLSHLEIQKWLGISVAILVLFGHFVKEILPLISSFKDFELLNLSPWIIAFYGCLIWNSQYLIGRKKYKEFLDNSPGITIDTSEIKYDIGHGFKNNHPGNGE
jgi:hypothetical protein